MKVLIDMPDTGLEETILKRGDWTQGSLFDINLRYSLKNAVIIPDNTTNGDMVMAMLNPYKICEYKYSVHVYMTEKDFWNGNYQMNLDSDWWNAPFKVESEEKDGRCRAGC